MDYSINIRFNSTVERTPRVMEVAEAFGIGLAENEFVIYDDLVVSVNSGDIVYITGQSGSGKSLLLRELARLMGEEGMKVASLDDVELEGKPIIDQVGDSMSQATGLLARVGIGDAQLYIRQPSQLSDGQKYRMKLAKLLESDCDVMVADEFGAVLDRPTAAVVAFNMQRAARDFGKTLIIATTHTDLVDELGPNVLVSKLYRERVKVDYDPTDGKAVLA